MIQYYFLGLHRDRHRLKKLLFRYQEDSDALEQVEINNFDITSNSHTDGGIWNFIYELAWEIYKLESVLYFYPQFRETDNPVLEAQDQYQQLWFDTNIQGDNIRQARDDKKASAENDRVQFKLVIFTNSLTLGRFISRATTPNTVGVDIKIQTLLNSSKAEAISNTTSDLQANGNLRLFPSLENNLDRDPDRDNPDFLILQTIARYWHNTYIGGSRKYRVPDPNRAKRKKNNEPAGGFVLG